MAKIEGEQDIPSELLDDYRATLGEQRPNDAVQKRYPFRMQRMQTGRGNATPAQRTQRSRFLGAMARFANETQATRGRWYAARPVWGSFLWYYNYYIMSDLTGNADQKSGGFGVIKSIQFKTISMPSGTGEGSVAITAIDPVKSVVMIFGNSFWVLETEAYGIAGPVYPYVSSLAAELVKCKWSVGAYSGNDVQAADIGVTVIEYV